MQTTHFVFLLPKVPFLLKALHLPFIVLGFDIYLSESREEWKGYVKVKQANDHDDGSIRTSQRSP